MARDHLRLRDDFLQHFHASGAYVKEAAVRRFAGQRPAPRNGHVGKMLRGEPVPASCIQIFVRFCRNGSRLAQEPPYSSSLQSYCDVRGLRMSAATLDRAVVECISEAAVADSRGPSWGFGLVVDMWKHLVDPRRFVRPASGAAEVRSAIEWLYVEVGRLMAGGSLRYEEGLEEGERRIGIPLRRYQEAALERHDYEPWTVALALDGRDAPIGTSVSLPVSSKCYGRVRCGALRPSLVSKSDLRSPSRHLLIEGIAMIPRAGKYPARKPGLALAYANLAQDAYLSAVEEGLSKARPLKMLTFGGTPETHRIVESFGFVRIGTRLCGTDIELVERDLHPANHGFLDAVPFGGWLYLRHRLGGPRAVKEHGDTSPGGRRRTRSARGAGNSGGESEHSTDGSARQSG